MNPTEANSRTILLLSDSGIYGGHPYGLEPLALPHKWVSPSSNVRSAKALLHKLPSVGYFNGDPSSASFLPPGGPDTEIIERVFWFRWITGHQVTFILWQLLSAAISDAKATHASCDDAIRRAIWYVRGYSLMLLYASSCPRELYQRVIRCAMARQHPHLSGSWARDYAPVRRILQGRAGLKPSEEAILLRHECDLNGVIHDGVADKLVPGGPSLLQAAMADDNQWRWRRDMLLTLYDAVFMTTRTTLPYDIVVGQLVRRLHVINLDIAANNLYPPYAPSEHEEPTELQRPDVAVCKGFFSETLSEIALTAVRSCTSA